MFYNTSDVVEIQATKSSKAEVPILKAICQLGGAAEGLAGRVKDFEVLNPLGSDSFIIVAGSSDGAVRMWTVDKSSIEKCLNDEVSISANGGDGRVKENATKLPATKNIGLLLGTYEAGNRITCLKAFVMSEAESLETNGSENGITGKPGKDLDSGDEDSTGG